MTVGFEEEFSFVATLKPALAAGAGPFGTRVVIEVTGGEVTGRRLNGRILTGGADWVLMCPRRVRPPRRSGPVRDRRWRDHLHELYGHPGDERQGPGGSVRCRPGAPARSRLRNAARNASCFASSAASRSPSIA
jgi:hypothetical protein